MEAVAQHLKQVADQDEQQAQSDYARIVKIEKPYKKDLARLAEVRQLLDIEIAQIESDREIWAEHQTRCAKIATEDEHRMALSNLVPQKRVAMALPAHSMSARYQRENALRKVGGLIARHQGMLEQIKNAKERLVELRSDHEFLSW